MWVHWESELPLIAPLSVIIKATAFTKHAGRLKSLWFKIIFKPCAEGLEPDGYINAHAVSQLYSTMYECEFGSKL